MVLLFKVTGLIIVFSVCAVSGYMKSYGIRKRAQVLTSVYRSMTLLSEYIKAGNGEISTILPQSFGEEFLDIKNSRVDFKKNHLENADIDLLTEFFTGFGFNDKNSEYERTKLFTALIKKQCDEASQNAQNLCKLYNTVGVLTGAFVCLFFL